MHKTSNLYWPGRPVVGLIVGALLALTSRAGPPTGEAIVAAQSGKASARVYVGPVHEGRTAVKDLFEGAAVGENSRVMTGKDGLLCMICSPGAILCVAPNTELTFTQLRHTADGLPQTEEDLIRRIHIQLHRGRIRVQAGAPTPTFDLRIETPAGAVEAHGGAFVVAQQGKEGWDVYCDAFELVLAPRNGTPTELKAGGAARLVFDAELDRGEVIREGVSIDPSLHTFELCNVFFSDLEPFISRDRPFDRAGLSQYLGLRAPFFSLDAGSLVVDASPSIRPQIAGVLPGQLPRPAEGEPGGRWDQRRIWEWFESIGTVKGVNYVPRTAVNSVEMWMEGTFDPDTMDEELGWAQDAGYTAIRVQLQFVVWKMDPEGFLKRVDKLLELAEKHGLRAVPVLFDDMDLSGLPPQPAPQPEPIPGKYNSRWVPSPAREAVTDRTQWPELERYVKSVMNRFKRDPRVLYWDLYNTAGNSGLGEQSLPLMDQTFNWARAVEARQPLAVPAWREFGSAMAARKLERSDLITFQSFDNVESLEARLMLLQRYQRPIICSDWLMRQTGNDFERVLPVFAAYRVGWFNRGLVKGKTQLDVQQEQFRSEREPDLWQQAVFHPDGTPYNSREIELIRGFQYLESSR